MAEHAYDNGDGAVTVRIFQFYGEDLVWTDFKHGVTGFGLTAEQARAYAADLIAHADALDEGSAAGRSAQAGRMDLDAAIRKRLNSYYSTPRGAYSHNFLLAGHDEMKAALLAVLDLHQEPGNVWTCPVCLEGVDLQEDSEGGGHEVPTMHRQPRPTVRAIAEKLGVEVSA